MNTAIKIIDKIMNNLEEQADMINTYDLGGHHYLSKARDRISSLPSLDIDSLQRFNFIDGLVDFSDTGEYIRYDDLKNLLQDTLELNQ